MGTTLIIFSLRPGRAHAACRRALSRPPPPATYRLIKIKTAIVVANTVLVHAGLVSRIQVVACGCQQFVKRVERRSGAAVGRP